MAASSFFISSSNWRSSTASAASSAGSPAAAGAESTFGSDSQVSSFASGAGAAAGAGAGSGAGSAAGAGVGTVNDAPPGTKAPAFGSNPPAFGLRGILRQWLFRVKSAKEPDRVAGVRSICSLCVRDSNCARSATLPRSRRSHYTAITQRRDRRHRRQSGHRARVCARRQFGLRCLPRSRQAAFRSPEQAGRVPSNGPAHAAQAARSQPSAAANPQAASAPTLTRTIEPLPLTDEHGARTRGIESPLPSPCSRPPHTRG